MQLAEKIIREDETATLEEMRDNIAGVTIPIGIAYWVLGDLAAAARCCEEALSYYKDVKTERCSLRESRLKGAHEFQQLVFCEGR